MANSMINNEFDIIVIGAGVAGGIFACSQKGKNIKVLVIERDLSEQERIEWFARVYDKDHGLEG